MPAVIDDRGLLQHPDRVDELLRQGLDRRPVGGHCQGSTDT
jgi:hypothetical protein